MQAEHAYVEGEVRAPNSKTTCTHTWMADSILGKAVTEGCLLQTTWEAKLQ